MTKSIKATLIDAFKNTSFTLKDAYQKCAGFPSESVRARIYENLGTAFERVGKGIYIAKDEERVLIEGDGRDLSFLEDNSIDCIITDHPWEDKKANKGGSRNFAQYGCFKYTQEDFNEKARVLKEGSFLVELIPAENETNYEYLYEMKKMAEAAGFQYYSKVPWIKGTFVSNTGRKSKNTEELMIFSKGKPRKLRYDTQRSLKYGQPVYMGGTAKMLPTAFNVQPIPSKVRIHPSEKPVLLFEQLLEYITLPGEIVVDQFAGSGAIGEACRNTGRKCVLVELAKEYIDKIAKRLSLEPLTAAEAE